MSSNISGIGRDPSRDAILASASRGWSPLQIKRSESPVKGQGQGQQQQQTSLGSPLDIRTSTGPRRTSNSFKHVKHNSLVSNSPFKSSGLVNTNNNNNSSPTKSINNNHDNTKQPTTTPSVAALTTPGRPLSLDSGERKVSGTMSGVGLGISASSPKSSYSRHAGGGGVSGSGGSGKKRPTSMVSTVKERLEMRRGGVDAGNEGQEDEFSGESPSKNGDSGGGSKLQLGIGKVGDGILSMLGGGSGQRSGSGSGKGRSASNSGSASPLSPPHPPQHQEVPSSAKQQQQQQQQPSTRQTLSFPSSKSISLNDNDEDEDDDDYPTQSLSQTQSTSRSSKQSIGLKGLAKGGLVSSSPFLTSDRSPEKKSNSEVFTGREGQRTLGSFGFGGGGGNGAYGESPGKCRMLGRGSIDEGERERDSPLRSSSSGRDVARQMFSGGGGGGSGVASGSPIPAQPLKPDVFSSPQSIKPVSKAKGNYARDLDFGPPNNSTPAAAESGPTGYVSTAQLEAELDAAYAGIPSKSLPSLPTSSAIGGSGVGGTNSNGPNTPTRSSITSRRLRGPRDTGSDSPTMMRQMKTVTFQAVPDVKEFETESVTDAGEGNSMEYSTDGEGEGVGAEADEREGDDSMEDVAIDGGREEYRGQYRQHLSRGSGYLGIPDHLGSDLQDGNSPMMSQTHEESMTANFIDSLVEDGYFSPPQVNEAEMASSIEQDTPPMLDFAPQLSTPSLGGSMSMTPELRQAGNSDNGHGHGVGYGEADERGIPYGRSHHIDRAIQAHSLEFHQTSRPMPQPDLPSEKRRPGEPTLRNADASQPSTGLPTTNQLPMGPYASQSGSFVDPFVTLETVTKLYKEETTSHNPQLQREEDEVPLGRSSHNERAKVARLMATQSLGLGMPRRPAHPGSAPTAQQAQPQTRQFSGESEDGSEGPASDSEDEPEFAEKRSSFQPQPAPPRMEHDYSQEDKAKRSSMEKRSLPQPPLLEKSRALSPVNLEIPAETPTETLVERSMYSFTLPFTLPAIGTTSPLLPSPLLSKDSAASTASSSSLGAPAKERKPLSDRLSLALDFGDPESRSGFRTTSEAFRMVEAALPPPSPPKASIAPKTDAPKVRQRISKDMIRQKMEERKQQQEQPASQIEPSHSISIMEVPVDSQTSSLEKGLPPTPSEAAWMASLFNKAEDDSVSNTPRPTLAPRTQSRSAEDVLRKAAEEGTMHAPKSALDRLVADLRPSEDREDNAKGTVGINDSPDLESRTKIGAGAQRDVGPETPGRTHPGSRRIPRKSVSNEEMRAERKPTQRMSILNMGMGMEDLRLSSGPSMLDNLQEELENITSDRAYRIHEQHQTVYASATSKIQTTEAGDTDSGKAWRQLRKPSDMNQYAKELKALKAKQAGMAKATGTVFVKVMGIESLNLPIPDQPTSFCVTLDNGIDYIRTPYSRLADGARVNQEFALVEHANFEFTLGLEIRRDQHIVQMLHGNMQKSIPSDAASMTSVARSTGGGFRNIFSSPKKASRAPKSMAPPLAFSQPVDQPENICHYFSTGDSTVGKTHIAFKPIAKNCDARLLEIRYPMSGYIRKAKTLAAASARDSRGLPLVPEEVAPVKRQICKVTLQIFRLPPLPGLTQEQLPQSIDECLRGMRHHAWHEHEYYEGGMTQRGGDCSAPRRRSFKVIGSNLVASNAVTKKTVFSIDLRKATRLIDENEHSGLNKISSDDEYDNMDRMPRSFTLVFDDGDKITFWTDSDVEKSGWMDALKILIGKIPSNPLWAEMLAARQRHNRQRAASGATKTSAEGGEGQESGE